MESSPKRRKLGHAGSGLNKGGLIDFESRDSSRLSTASTFVLQTDELLKDARLNHDKVLADVDGYLHRLKETIDAIEPHDPLPIAQATASLAKKHRIIVPYPEPKPSEDAPYKVAYEKPAQYNVVGSYVSKTMVKTQTRFGIDMVVQIPKSLFQDKDYMNMRYFYRRAYYIAHIAAHVRKGLDDSVVWSFEYLNDNPLLPVLVLRPASSEDSSSEVVHNRNGTKKHTAKPEYTIRLIPCAPDEIFPMSKLAPSSNCNRTGEADDKKGAHAPTPFYNSTLKADGTFISYLRLLSHSKTVCPAFSDACILGRMWLQQRGFGSAISEGGFGHFEWSVMVALLLQTGGRKGKAVLSASLSSTELFKAAVQFLATTDFNKSPFVFGNSKLDADKIREPGPVILDAARDLNILFKMSSWAASLLQLHAKATTNLLADDAADKFEPIFIIKTDGPLHIFDAVFQIKSSAIFKCSDSLDRRGAVWNFSLEAQRVLKRAYGNRAQLVHVQQPQGSPWPLTESHPDEAHHVLVGVIFDPAQMSRQMEHGPSAEEQKEAAKFRQFWGDKAELRRFKDGSILECLEWSARLPFHICEEISRYILKRHLKISKDELSFYGSAFSSVINISHTDKEAFDSARKAFQTFEHDIRSLDDLPLQVRQLSPISSLARYTSIEPPAIGFHQGSVELMDVNMYFEASNKWPENIVAIQEAKIDFLLDIDRRLTAAHENIKTHLGRENRDVGLENLAYLDIVYDAGAAFRLRIHSDLEEILLERQIKNKTLKVHVREDSEETLARFHWLFTTLPLHTQTMATFCTRLQALSQTVRLVKHWFNSHKLSGQISEELVELFVLHVFLQPHPWPIPSSATTGLLRTLAFLSRWDWRDEPLIVDSAESLTGEERSAIHRKLESWRRRDPQMNRTVMIVATSHDQSGLAYTRDGPSKLVASRMTRLAKAACKLVKEQGVQLSAPLLFATSLRDYDVLIHFSPKATRAILRDAATEGGAKKHSQFKNLDDRTGRVPLPVRAHPVEALLSELRRVYEDTMVFFSGGAGDAVVGAIWNPKLQRQKFRAGLQYNFTSVSGEDGDIVEVNRGAVLLEIARIGGDMITKIEVEE